MQGATDPGKTLPPAPPSLGEAALVWLRIGCVSFGGPAGQIGLMHREVVETRHWVSDRRFLQALNFCHLLPGPEAQQLATYLGWLMHGPAGGLVAGLLFVAPGALVMLALSILYATLGAMPAVEAVFFGLKSAVLALVLEALLRIARRALKGRWAWALAGLAFVALFVFSVPFPVVVLAAGAIGTLAPPRFAGAGHKHAEAGPPALLDAVLADDPERAARLARGAWRAGLIALAAWLLPVAALALCGGVFADVARFFSKMAVVTFGGAYAVLAYAAQQAVGHYHWLSAHEMLTGLGLAETTPGPLILVLQFVGFLAGYRAPGPLSGIAGGVVASAVTLWVSFAPCFAFVFLGAPLIERLQGNRALAGALAAITAAVVGVVANLAMWFALHALFLRQHRLTLGGMRFEVPAVDSVDWLALGIAALAGVAVLKFRLGVVRTLALCALASLAAHWAGIAEF